MTAINSQTHSEPVDLRPVFASMFACSATMMGFVVIAGPLATRLNLAPWQLGLSVTVAALAWVISARAWGRQSDIVGRRTVILRGMTLFLFAYGALCLVVGWGLGPGLPPIAALAGLIICRTGLGFGYAAVPSAANALIADHYPPEARPGVMGRLGAGQAFGLVIGPALVAGMAATSLLVPLLVLAILPILSILAVQRLLPKETPQTGAKQNLLTMKDPRIRTTCAIAFIVMLCVGTAQITVGFVAIDRLQLSPEKAAQVSGIALTLVGFCLIGSQLLLGRLPWSSDRFILMGSIVAGVGFLGASLTQSVTGLILWYGVSGFGAGWIFPSVSARAANRVNAQEQGQAAGSISAAQGLGAMIGPLAGTVVYELHDALPMAVSAGLFFIVSCFMIWAQSDDKQDIR